MPRGPGNADRLLLKAAKAIVSKEGCSGLRVRELADRAGVNLGMFHYHFKSKKRFKRVLIQEMYDEFFEEFVLASKDGPDPLSQLRNSLFAFGRFVRDQRGFCVAIFKDVLNEDPEVLRFVRMNVFRHGSVIAELIEKCQKAGRIAPLPPAQILSFLLSGMNMPTLLGGTMERRGSAVPREFVDQFKKHVLTDEGIRQRIDLALKGLAP